jgi:hypothetical protein
MAAVRTAGKLGRLPAIRPYGLRDLASYTKTRLPSPPAEVATPAVADWGMLDNDTIGCCTIAGVGHAIMAWDAELHTTDTPPDDAEVQSQYFAITGGQDTGCVEASVLALWEKSGLFEGSTAANKIVGYAPVDVKGLTEVHQAIAFYGCAYIGVNLPASAQTQFQDNQPWTVVPGSKIEGGHCVVLVGYDSQYATAVTWGATVQVSYPWLAKYMDECWAVISQEVAEAGKGPALDLASLEADIAALNQ